MSPYIVQTLVFLVIMGTVYWIILKWPININKHPNWQSRDLGDAKTIAIVISKLEQLYANRMIVLLRDDDGIISFKSAPSLLSWGNTYVITRSQKSHKNVLYYRGSLFKWQVDRANLQTMLFILKVDETPKASIA